MIPTAFLLLYRSGFRAGGQNGLFHELGYEGDDVSSIGHTQRKSMLYRTKVEYGDWAMNHVQGCAHGCLYPCYAFLMARRFGRTKTYEEWMHPRLVDNTLELLEKELPKYRDEIRQVQLCFTTDPFMEGYPEVADLSLKAIDLINGYDIPCVILTKGVLPDTLKTKRKANQYGITCVSLSESFREQMEPGAAPISKRIEALEVLHDAGCRTWVSIEPYPTPNVLEQELVPILERVSFANRIVFGRTHYDKKTGSYTEVENFYHEAAAVVGDFCGKHGIECRIKRGTIN